MPLSLIRHGFPLFLSAIGLVGPLGLVAAAEAAEPAHERQAPPSAGEIAAATKALCKRFDADKDGVCDRGEWLRARAWLQQRRGAGGSEELAMTQRAAAGPALAEREALTLALREWQEASRERQRAALADEHFDADGDGELDLGERRRLRLARYAQRFETTPDKLLADFDADEDGELDASELRAAMATDRQRIETLERTSRFDADGDGRLTRGERAAAQQAVEQEEQARRERQLRIFERADRDGDGQLSAAEFLALVEGKAHGERPERERPRRGKRPAGPREGR